MLVLGITVVLVHFGMFVYYQDDGWAACMKDGIWSCTTSEVCILQSTSTPRPLFLEAYSLILHVRGNYSVKSGTGLTTWASEIQQLVQTVVSTMYVFCM